MAAVLQFLASEDLLLSSGTRGLIHFWDVPNRKEIRRPLKLISPAVPCPNGVFIASRGENSSVVVHDLASGNLLQTLAGPDGVQSEVSSIAISPNGLRLATAHGDIGTVRLWSRVDESSDFILRWEYTYKSSIGTIEAAFNIPPRVHALAFLSTDGMLASVVEKVLYIADAATGTFHRLINLRGTSDFVSLSPKNARLVAGEYTGEQYVRVYDLETGEQIREITAWTSVAEWIRFMIFGGFLGPLGGMFALLTQSSPLVVYSPDEAEFACVFGKAPSAIKIMTADGSKPVQILRTGQGTVCAVAFSPSGDLLASLGNNATTRLWRKVDASLSYSPLGPPILPT